MTFSQYDARLLDYIERYTIPAEHLRFSQSTHSVAEAAEAVGVDVADFVKNICMIDDQERVIVAIVKGEDRASTSRVAKALTIDRPRIANPEEILEKTGFPCGGTPSFGFEAVFLIDPRVMDKKIVYTGGGTPNSLCKIAPEALVKANDGQVVRIRS